MSWYDGGPAEQVRRTATPVRTTPPSEAAAAGIAEDNGTTTIDDPEDELILNAQTVQHGRRDRAH